MRPAEHNETNAKTETETKNCYKTETTNYEAATKTDSSLVNSIACETITR